MLEHFVLAVAEWTCGRARPHLDHRRRFDVNRTIHGTAWLECEEPLAISAELHESARRLATGRSRSLGLRHVRIYRTRGYVRQAASNRGNVVHRPIVHLAEEDERQSRADEREEHHRCHCLMRRHRRLRRLRLSGPRFPDRTLATTAALEHS